MAGSSLTKVEAARARAARVKASTHQVVTNVSGTATSVLTGGGLGLAERHGLPSKVKGVPLRPIYGVAFHAVGAFTKGGGVANRVLHAAGDIMVGIEAYESAKTMTIAGDGSSSY